jgi:pyruvate dehydrogenase E1 component alpha subunit
MTREELIAFEAHVAELFKQGKINCPIHLSGGNETELIEIFENIRDEDYVLSTHRNHYRYLLKGGDPQKLLDEILGKPTGCCKGVGRSMHIFDTSMNFYTTAIIGGMCAVACGLGLAGKKVWCFVGDGTSDTGAFYEAVRYAFCKNLPVKFIIEDNDKAVETTKAQRWGLNIGNPVMQYPNVIYYTYERTWPHVGIGEHVSM